MQGCQRLIGSSLSSPMPQACGEHGICTCEDCLAGPASVPAEARRIQASKAERAPAQQGARPGQQPPKPKPYQTTHYDREVVEYVRNATRDNVWYYRDR